MNTNKLLLATFTCAVTLLLVSCDSGNQYDKGYEAAWSGQAKSSFAASQYSEGYEQGLADAYIYDAGNYDAREKRAPQHLEDPDYMDGYKDEKNG